MQFDLNEAIAVLERTPALLQVWLNGLPGAWTVTNEGPETWSPYVVLGHLAHGERADWIPRVRLILEHGETQTFEPYDRFAQFTESAGKSLPELLAEFATRRAQNVQTLRAWQLSEADLDKTGTHPAFGQVSLRALLATWVAHDLDHVAQIARVMAKQYTTAVGPWSAYLRILQERLPTGNR
ncbi:MAG: DinB family protein [Acidobacteria bacterium]|nr:DinB family protein [Acidobacteriota bacterium]MBI3426582.1 DinB family protein [Acidobacteriota bacterium]